MFLEFNFNLIAMRKNSFILFIFMFIGSFLYAQEEQDWANLKRFQEENKKLGKQTPENYIPRIVFIGNSITEGWLTHSPDFFTNESYINRGISGQTTPQMLLRFRQDVVQLEPNVVVILAGTNDIAGNTGSSTLEMIQDNIASMCEIAEANGIDVLLCSVLPVYDYPWSPGLQPAEKIKQLNQWIKEYASINEWMYIDYYSALVDERGGLPAKYSGDGVHPTKAGYAVMEGILKEALDVYLNQ